MKNKPHRYIVQCSYFPANHGVLRHARLVVFDNKHPGRYTRQILSFEEYEKVRDHPFAVRPYLRTATIMLRDGFYPKRKI